MNKTLKILLAAILCTLLSILLLACDEEVCQHRDADDNSLCDKCNESYTDGKDVEDEHKHSFTLSSTHSTYLVSSADCENAARYYYFCSCGEIGEETYESGNPLGHDEVSHEAKAPTCTEIGYDAYVTCTRCDYTTYSEKAALGHDEVTLSAKDATCTEAGLTDGKKCDRCGEILVVQNTLPILPHSYDDVYDTTCNECGFVRDADCAHIELETIPEVPATCTTSGLTEGKKCKACGEITLAQTVIGSLGHNEVTLPEKAATCTEEGLTEGKKCDRCDTVFTPQDVLPILPHTYDDRFDATCNECGFVRDADCAHIELETIPEVPATCTTSGLTEGKKCKACGEITLAQTVIGSLGHNEVTLPEKAATCTEEGLTEGKKCDRCNTVLLSQNTIVPTGHSYGEWITTKPATCTEEGIEERYCSCGDKQSSTLAKIPHSFGQLKIYNNGEADCEKKLYFRDCSACSEIEWTEGKYEDHTWSTVTTAPTCIAGGYDTKTCNTCGKVEICNETSSTAHTYSTEYVTDNSFHWFGCTYCDAIKGKAEHTLASDGFCSICKTQIGPTPGIVYELSYDKTYYEVVAYGGTATKIKIADIYNGLPVKTIYSDAFSNNNNITAVIIPDSITSIGISAFAGCDSLESVTIGNGVTSIGNAAFSYCSSLARVTIGNRVTTIGSSAFYECSSLVNITIPNSVTHIGYEAFRFCSKLIKEYNFCSYVGDASNPYEVLVGVTTQNLSAYEIQSGTRILAYGAFEGCSRLASITIPDSITSIGDQAFAGCSSLKAVHISNISAWCNIDFYNYLNSNPLYLAKKLYLNGELATNLVIPEDVTAIKNYAFYGYTSLVSITLPDSFTFIGDNAFYACSSLARVTIGNSVTSIGEWAFYNCSSLASITIGNNVTSIGDYAFYNCSSLVSITIPDSVTSIGGDAFRSCYSLTSVTIPDSVTSIGQDAFSGCSSLTSVTIGNGVTSIGDRAFYYCDSLTSITIPNSVTSIGDRTFYHCSSLANVTIGNSVTSIGSSAFSWCSSLTSITIPDSVTSIGSGAFSSCSKLTSITIPDSVTSIGEWAFSSCSKLVSITIPDSVTSIGERAFEGCSKLVSITIPDSITSIGSGAFLGCSSLTSITIPDSVTSIGSSAFYNCSSLTSITIPNSVTSIDVQAFFSCSSLTSVTIPDSVTSIDVQAFFSCSSLTSVTIPDSVTSIGRSAFSGCDSLTDVYYGSTKDDFEKITIAAGNDCLKNANIHYAQKYSTGLEYSEKHDGTYEVKSIGTCKDTDIIIPDSVDGKAVTSIGYMAFYDCSSLESITIPSSVTFIGEEAFARCTSFSIVDIPNGVQTIERAAFYDCRGLASITIPKSVTTIGYRAFSGAINLVEVINHSDLSITKGADDYTYLGFFAFIVHSGERMVESINGYNFITYEGENYLVSYTGQETELVLPSGYNGKYVIKSEAFTQNRNITSVVIPSAVKALGEYSFGYCTLLESVTIPEGITVIPAYAFEQCAKLKNVILPYGLTSIERSAFWKCTSLEWVSMPETLTSIGDGCFEQCSKLKNIYYAGTVAEWNAVTKGNLWAYNVRYTMHYEYVPEESNTPIIPY